jgi:excisionase family DNA binding protein
MGTTMDNLLSVEKTAEVLSISPWTVRAWITKGKLGSTKLGSRRLVPQSEIEKLIANGRMAAVDNDYTTTNERTE